MPGRCSLEERVPTTRRVVVLSPRLTCPLVRLVVTSLVVPDTLFEPDVRIEGVVLRVPV